MTDLVPVPVVAPSQVDTLRLTIVALDKQRELLAIRGEWEVLVAGMIQLDQLLRDLRELRAAVEHDITTLIPSKREFVEGVGTVEVKTDVRRRNWQSRELAEKVVTMAMDAGDCGHPLDVVNLLMDVFSISAAKVTALRARGFDPDEWCQTEFGHKTIRVTS